MFSLLFSKFRFLYKAIFIVLLLIASLCGGYYLFLRFFSDFLFSVYSVQIDMLFLLKAIPIWIYFVILGGVVLVLLWVLLDMFVFVKNIRKMIKDSLAERQLEASLNHFVSGKNFYEVHQNLLSVLSLFRSFDTMKTDRISIEMSSIKQLLNQIKEGVLFINNENVVTHINHVGEQLLGLIPGEIIGESVSRKISHSVFLEGLSAAFENDKKITGETFSIKEDVNLDLYIIPIKDKYGVIVRCIVVLFESEKDSSGEDKS